MVNSEFDKGTVLFRETQWFQPRWLWALVLASAIIVWSRTVRSGLNFHGGANVSFAIFWLVLGVIAPAFLISYRQVTEVRDDGIYVRRSPFPRSSDAIRFSQFYRYQARNCSPIYSAGGWGIAQGWQGKAYNMGGKDGVELLLVGGGRVLIGTCKMRQLLDVLHSQCGVKVRRPQVAEAA